MTGDDYRSAEPIADCRLRGALDLFAHTWDPVVLAALADGPRRRVDLRTEIGGIRDKTLTEALRRLLGRGLVFRRPDPDVPPGVEYRLTELGTSLVEGPLRALAAWVREHGDELPVPEGADPPLRSSG
ncbi:winged helix-turn-helix transcriptional regulator [Nocardia sp. NBC_01329]|uniref:winged helix-turn-helix transcriptional regulator n=1 Tax=Nocardia sp. NBC_01329 TaxID=2903594 RepID=UPI002E149D32|nr:helix-turn-helix transcriptional regulator [Nocardia sp. NBC_01329]